MGVCQLWLRSGRIDKVVGFLFATRLSRMGGVCGFGSWDGSGVAYGMQLSLLVLAILQVFVGYDFLLHPEGPAMMAMIIPCTSVTRDAFEIGVVQRLLREGTVVPTFPNGEALRDWFPRQFSPVMEVGRVGYLWRGSKLLDAWERPGRSLGNPFCNRLLFPSSWLR